MILNGSKIDELTKNKILIENVVKENIRGASYDITGEDYILKFKVKKKPISFTDIEGLESLYTKINIKDGYELKPRETILIPIIDTFNIPNNICAHIRGRTSFNRLGLSLTLQHLNPGYKGKLNITLTNQSPNTFVLLPNMRFGQVVFEQLDNQPSEDLLYYNEKTPIYYKEDGSQGSKIYADLIGKVVRHYKGNYYYIEDICLNSETKEYMIIYKTLYDRTDSNIWTRPAKMFFDEIDKDKKDNKLKQTHRFEIVDSLTLDYTKENQK